MDPYAVLDLTPGATPREVAAAYRRLAKRLHPDVAPGPEAAARMAELNAAYAAIRNGEAPPAPPAPPRDAPAHAAGAAPHACRVRVRAPRHARLDALEPGDAARRHRPPAAVAARRQGRAARAVAAVHADPRRRPAPGSAAAPRRDPQR